MREPPRISEEDLRACLQDQYDLSPVALTFLPLGHDYDAGMYRVESEQGRAYAPKRDTGLVSALYLRQRRLSRHIASAIVYDADLETIPQSTQIALEGP